MKKIILLIALLVSTACSSGGLDNVDKELQPYVKHIISESEGKLTEDSFSNTRMYLSKHDKQNIIGYCYPLPFFKIITS